MPNTLHKIVDAMDTYSINAGTATGRMVERGTLALEHQLMMLQRIEAVHTGNPPSEPAECMLDLTQVEQRVLNCMKSIIADNLYNHERAKRRPNARIETTTGRFINKLEK